MIVITRRKNESIVINDDTTVTVVEIRDDKVRLGVVAPKEIPIHRQEIFDAIHSSGVNGHVGTVSEIARLQAELAKTQKKLNWYQETMTHFIREAWKGITQEELDRLAKENSPVEGIIAELKARAQQ